MGFQFSTRTNLSSLGSGKSDQQNAKATKLSHVRKWLHITTLFRAGSVSLQLQTEQQGWATPFIFNMLFMHSNAAATTCNASNVARCNPTLSSLNLFHLEGAELPVEALQSPRPGMTGLSQ